MKIRVYISYLILFALFAASLRASDVCALTCLEQSKSVFVDENWRITGRYAYEFEILHPEDALETDHLIQRFTPRTDKISTTVHLSDGRKTEWTAIDKNNPPAGAWVKIEFTISDIFPGFEGLFADTMYIDQTAPVKKAAYQITFPEKTAFVCQIVQNGQNKHSHKNESFKDVFSWSGENIHSLNLKISTATSWQQISDRYQSLFQSRIINKFSAMTSFPELFKNIDSSLSDDEKIQKVMNFFKTNFDYQNHLDGDHHLLPNDPATVIHRRCGDCKDMALIEVLTLKSMGIDAFVVLSGNPLEPVFEKTIPDPFIFNHAMIGIFTNSRATYYDSFVSGNIVAVNDENMYLHLKVSYDAQ